MPDNAQHCHQLLGVLVASDGGCIPDGSPEFLALLGDFAPDYDAALFAVRNMGFVYWRRVGSLLDIVVHPKNVREAAVAAMLPIIGLSGAERFKITYLSEFEWREETAASARQACIRFLAICRTSRFETAARSAFG